MHFEIIWIWARNGCINNSGEQVAQSVDTVDDSDSWEFDKKPASP